MWQHTEGMMGSIIWILLEIYFFFQQWKDFENPLRIDKGIAMSVLLFLGHSLDMLSMVCFNDFTNPPAVNRVIAFTLVIQSSELKFHLWLCPEFGMKLVTHSRDERPSSLLELTVITWLQGDHLSGKPGNVREFDSCQGNVRDFTESRGKILSGKSCLKLFIVSCIFVSIQVFSRSPFCVKY